LSDEALRALFASRPGAGEPSPSCPLPETFFDATMGALPSAETLKLIEHSVSCASCSQAFRLARELAAELEPAPLPLRLRDGISRDGISPALRKTLLAITGLAAAAALFLVVRPSPTPVYRADAVELASRLDTQPIPREQFVLRWSALAAGTRYSVNVATPDLNVLFARGGLMQAEVQVPASALAKVPAGGQVVWRVTALLADGRRIESTAFLTTVQ